MAKKQNKSDLQNFIDNIKDESDKYLEIVLSESKRLSRLVNDLLNISRKFF